MRKEARRTLASLHQVGSVDRRLEQILNAQGFNIPLAAGVPKSGRRDIYPLFNDFAHSQTQDLIDGKIVDWNSPSAIETSYNYFYRKKDLRRPRSILYSGENGEVFSMLADDLERFKPGMPLFNSPQTQEWFCKLFVLGVNIHYAIYAEEARDNDKVDLNSGKHGYKKVVEEQMEQLNQTLASLEIGDLSSYLRFEEQVRELTTIMGRSVPYKKTQQVAKEEQDAEEKQSETTSLYFNFLEKDQETWERLKVKWGWKQVQETMSLIPDLRSKFLIDVFAALEENLIDLSPKDSKTSQGELEDDPNWKVRKESTAFLLLVPWWEYFDKLWDDYPILAKELEKNLEFADFSVPKKYLPSAAIEYLTKVGEIEKPERLMDLIKGVHSLTKDKPKAPTTPWLTALLALRGKFAEVDGFLKEEIRDWRDVPELARQILLNEVPGRLWLNNQGRLRITKGNETLSAFPIYKSSYESAGPVQAAEAVIVDFANPREIVPVKSVTVPLFRETGLVSEEDIPYLIDNIFAKRNGSVGSAELVKKWGEVYESRRTLEKAIIYPAKINSNEPFLKQAGELGVEGVMVQGDNVTFVIAGNGDRQRMAINGKLLSNGELVIPGMEGSGNNLALANIALACAVRPTYTVGTSPKMDKEIRDINGPISDWNGSRGNLPKIARDGYKKAEIGIIIPGFEETMLVGVKK
ncbi:hypothetical protein C4559_03910 [Candidatus Microgenomates bacterium]|nr:MAG: hypothetical protein C4559_03910 [Candidatus Microgenomates bacterium]